MEIEYGDTELCQRVEWMAVIHHTKRNYLTKRRFQSSPSPRGWRYAREPATAKINIGFNPRPPLEEGATCAVLRACQRLGYVSILALP